MWPPEGGYFCAINWEFMVRILTKDYTELDLTKGFEFQIEMENPMLDEEHIPSAFQHADLVSAVAGEQEACSATLRRCSWLRT